MISHAQNAEDVVLRRVFKDVETGFYVDVGASDPVEDSVTFHFYACGWSGVNAEPDPREYQRLVAERARDVNINAAVGEGDDRVLFYPGAVRGHGTVKAELAEGRGHGPPVEVARMSLGNIFEAHWPSEGVDFLKIDVEGSEADVLASADWRRWRPRIVVVEAVDETGVPNHDMWEPSLLAAGYRFGLFDGVNRFYCREEDVHLLAGLSAPANVLDNWRPIREVALQDLLQTRLAQEVEAHEAMRRAHEAMRRTHEATSRALAEAHSANAEARRALVDERSAHAETERALENVYASTSWRLTSPVRDASRLAKLMGWGRTPTGSGRPAGG